MSDSLSSVWGGTVHFAKCPMLRFSKGQSSPNFHQFQPNFMESVVIRGMQAITFLAIYQILQIYRTLKIVLLAIRLSVFHVAKGQGPWPSCGNCVDSELKFINIPVLRDYKVSRNELTCICSSLKMMKYSVLAIYFNSLGTLT